MTEEPLVIEGSAPRARHPADAAAWDDRYAVDELVWSAAPNPLIAEQLAATGPGRVLDLGCGEGRHALWLAERGWLATGLDFSTVALAKGQQRSRSLRLPVAWVLVDVRLWRPVRAALDLVLLAYLHLPGTDRRAVLRAAAYSLRPGGLLLGLGHDRTNLTDGVGGPQDPAILWDPDELVTDLAGTPVQVVRAERVHRPVPDADRSAVDTLLLAHRS